ncbi:MAG: hypothetical protein GVY14_04290 [Spirochaetes bacterium]|jgi:hypothetical protein|nr:hypothetical protein [Spirochaetota bacterium]
MGRSRNRIEQEANDHIALGTLLQRYREGDHAAAVQRVVDGHMSVFRKIEEIRRLDARYLGSAEADLASSGGASRRQGAGNGAAAGRRRGSDRRLASAKAMLLRASWLHYMFSDFGRIRRFGEKTETLRCRFFPPSIRLENGLGSRLARRYQKRARELWLLLNRVEESGWLHLTVRQYNLLMVARRLSRELMNASFAFRKSDHSKLVDRYVPMENAFLILRSREEYLSEMKQSLTVLEEVPEPILPRRNGGGAALEAFYRRAVSDNADFSSVRNRILTILPVILRAYVNAFEAVLDGKVSAAGKPDARLFPEHANRTQLETLRDAATTIERHRPQAEILNHQRFHHLRRNTEETLEAEFPLIHCVEDICGALNRIRAVCVSALREEDTPPELRELLFEPIRVTEDLLVYLADDRTLNRREEEQRITLEIRRKIKTLERIAMRPVYQSVRDSFAPLIELS